MSKKFITALLIVISTVGIAALTTFVVMEFFTKDPVESKNRSIDEVVESSFDVPEITTNLKSKNIVRLSFKIEASDKKAREELEKREFQIKDIIITELANMEAKDLEGKAGMDRFKDTIKKKVDALLQEGEVKQVYTTSFILQ